MVRRAAVLLAAVVVLSATSCQYAKVGARCSPAQGAARNDTHVLFCVKGRWKATLTIGQAADVIIGTLPGSLESQPGPALLQTTYAGDEFGAHLGAILRNRKGQPMPGRTVTFTAPSTGPGFEGPSTTTAVTNVNGFALLDPALRVGPTFGNFVVTASAEGVAPVKLNTIRVAARTPDAVADVSGQDQSIVAGHSLAPVVLAVTDLGKRPAWGAVARVADSHQGLTGPLDSYVFSESRGNLTVTPPLLTEAGQYAVDVMVTGPAAALGARYEVLHQVRWTVHAGPAVSYEADTTQQTVSGASEYPATIVVTVYDAYDNPVEHAGVTLTVVPGAGGASGSLADVTDNGGAGATARARSNGVVGTFVVRATIPGFAPVDFTLHTI